MRRILQPVTGTTRSRSRGALGIALAATLALAACSTPDGQDGQGDDAAVTSGADAGSGADAASATTDAGSATADGTAGIDPDALPDPVAEVNGEQITRADFVEVFEQQLEASRQQEQAGGPPVDEVALSEGVLESLVGSALLTQEGERLGLEASNEEIDAELDTLAELNGVGSGDELVAVLGEQGMAEEQVREEVGRLLLIDELVQEQGQVQAPGEEELRAYYEELTGSVDGADDAAATGRADDSSVPAFEDVQEQLAEQLTRERENEALATILEELEEDAEIVRNL
ncbi:SurA N-terminal domain-containing protein [Ornithinimicrobium sp. W1679]|uniref:SurA N-terminal domain-containing protein n=1 Tax=Ornithinimicrobium sp. W1679 TaxID=3418770 RepID=UPI003CEAC59D